MHPLMYALCRLKSANLQNPSKSCCLWVGLRFSKHFRGQPQGVVSGRFSETLKDSETEMERERERERSEGEQARERVSMHVRESVGEREREREREREERVWASVWERVSKWEKVWDIGKERVRSVPVNHMQIMEAPLWWQCSCKIVHCYDVSSLFFSIEKHFVFSF